MTTTRIRDLAERHWNGQGDLVHAHHPVMPVEGRVAEEILDDVLYVKSVASISTIDTGDGLGHARHRRALRRPAHLRCRAGLEAGWRG